MIGETVLLATPEKNEPHTKPVYLPQIKRARTLVVREQTTLRTTRTIMWGHSGQRYVRWDLIYVPGTRTPIAGDL